MSKGKRRFSKFLSVLLIFLVVLCGVLFYQIVTKTDVNILGFRFYYVLTESMAPTIQPGSVIVVRKIAPEKLSEGDIISFRSSDPAIYGMVNTHRIAEILTEGEERVFVTWGDNNPSPDAYTVSEEDIKGKVIFHTGPVDGLKTLLEFIGTKKGFCIVIVMPLLLIASWFMESFAREFRRSVKTEKKEIETLYEEKEVKQTVVTGKKPEELTVEELKEMLSRLNEEK